MKRHYEAWNPDSASMDVVHQANVIVNEYDAQGYDLTLRQLYYQFVARGYIPNTQKSYKRLGTIVNKGRLAGFIDWEAIVDRTRSLRSLTHWSTPSDIVDATAHSYHRDLWADQKVRVEVWVEKEALAGVVERAASDSDCAWFSCRGYVSQSELWVAARRHLQYMKKGQRVVVLHLGDHDPSGIDMTRDMASRLDGFLTMDWLHEMMPDTDIAKMGDIRRSMNVHLGLEDLGLHDALEVRRIALNMDQVEEYDPPPNPTKLTDSRSAGYVEAFGSESWELDALDPATLAGLIEDEIDIEVDHDKLEAQREQQRVGRVELTRIAQRYDDVVALVNQDPEPDDEDEPEDN